MGVVNVEIIGESLDNKPWFMRRKNGACAVFKSEAQVKPAARPSRDERSSRSSSVASDYTMYLFASIKIRRQRVLPGSVCITLSSNESAFILTHRGIGIEETIAAKSVRRG